MNKKIDNFLYQYYFDKYEKESLFKQFYSRYRKFRLSFGDPVIYYNAGEYKINIPLSQNLFFYQKSYPFFNKRLRQILNYIKSCNFIRGGGTTIVDIGANIGDTILGMGVENKDEYYIAIEGAEKYYSLLEKNLTVNKVNNYTIYQTFLSDRSNDISYAAICNNGTGCLVKGENGAETVQMTTLDELLRDRDKTIDLIKIDTDGFDYKILRGGRKLIVNDKPTLYFEYQIEDWIAQGEDIYKVYEFLIDLGYSKGLFFDNYGNAVGILEFTNLKEIRKLVNIVLQHETEVCYYDILTIHDDNKINLIDLFKQTNNKYIN